MPWNRQPDATCDELHRLGGPVVLELVQDLAHQLGIERGIEQPRELRDGDRLPGREQRRLENALDLLQIVHRVNVCRMGYGSSTKPGPAVSCT